MFSSETGDAESAGNGADRWVLASPDWDVEEHQETSGT